MYVCMHVHSSYEDVDCHVPQLIKYSNRTYIRTTYLYIQGEAIMPV